MRVLGVRDFYKAYRREVPNARNLEVFLLVSEGFNEFMMNKVINEGEEVSFPERLGRLMILGRKLAPTIEGDKIKGLTPNWKATMEFWNKNPEAKQKKELVYHFNESTNGIRYRLHWTKKNVYVVNKDFYTFRLTRANKKRVVKSITSGKEYYIEILKIK